jgi:hypothetical protein
MTTQPLKLAKAWHFFIDAAGGLAGHADDSRLTVGIDAAGQVYLFGPALEALSEGKPVSQHAARAIGAALRDASGEST